MIERRLRATRRALIAVIVARAVISGAAAAVAILLVAAIAEHLVILPRAVREALAGAAAAAGLLVTVATAADALRLRSLSTVALWIEERVPRLGYVLVTATDPRISDEIRTPLADSVPDRELSGLVGGRLSSALGRPALALAVVAAALLVASRGSVAAVLDPEREIVTSAPLLEARTDRIGRVTIELTPPAYANAQRRTLDDPAIVAALPGSVLRIRIRGGAPVSGALLGDRAVRRGDDGRFVVTMPASGVVLRISSESDQRLISLEPLTDDPPTVQIIQPVRDSVLREPRGELRLEAHAADDFGLRDGAFEWIVSSGEGELFTFRSGRVGSWAVAAREQRFVARIDLDSLRMGPGDVLHVRAVARDGNTVGGPSIGSSETRAFRVPRRGEYDSVAVEGAPPPEVDRSAVSQRMLIQLAEALERRRPRIDRQTLLRESVGISTDQKRLRRAVGDVIFMRLGGEATGEHSHDDGHDHGDSPEELLAMAMEAANRDPQSALDFEGDETPVVAISRPLLRAYNAMWAASMELDQGSPATALPHMREALDALQEARMAERIYLRGRPPTVVVDIDRVRMQGRTRGESSSRQGNDATPRAVRARVDRLERALMMARTDAGAAADSLLVLRLDLLGENPAAVDALSDAVTALRRGNADEAARALARARFGILGAPVRGNGIGAWTTGGGW